MNRLSIRIEFESSGGRMGPSLALLLDRIGERGLIRKAAVSLGMGYRHAWRLIQRPQGAVRSQIVATATGGVAGGGTKLTTLGTELLSSYRRIEERAGSAARADMPQLSGMQCSEQSSQISAAKPPPGRDRRVPLAKSPRLSLRTKSR